jgi:hypothetical protein
MKSSLTLVFDTTSYFSTSTAFLEPSSVRFQIINSMNYFKVASWVYFSFSFNRLELSPGQEVKIVKYHYHGLLLIKVS